MPEAPKEIQEIEFDTDSCQFKVDGLGTIGFRIVEREPNKTIKFESENIPMMKFNAWVQLKQTAENETHMKLTLKADMPMMVKMMIDSKIKDGINRVADTIATAINKSVND